MFSSLVRPKQHRDQRDAAALAASPSTGPAFSKPVLRRHATADFTEADDDDEDSQEQVIAQYGDEDGDGPAVDDEDNIRTSLPVLPLFSATYLGESLVFSSFLSSN